METTIAKELEDLKSSINLAHENQKVTQDQVSSCIRNQKNTDTLVARLEFQLREMQEYTRVLEDYCISLDTAVRRHHLILTGVLEYKNESLAIICYRVLQVCYPAIDISDIDYCYRLGSAYASAKGRPVLIKLVKESVRKEILKNRKYLIGNIETSRVFINEDLPQIVNDRRANIKSVHENAVRKGHNSKMMGTRVSVDNVTYNFSQLEDLPEGLKLSDSKLVAVKGGLAFSSEHSFLSNFHSCSFHINGQQFHSSEQAYQFIRAKKLGAPEIADKVMRAKSAKECKKQSYLCTSTPEWDQEKRAHMKVIVQEKFFQNDNLQTRLLDTGVNTLIEATTDTFWGAGAVLGSKLLSSGRWSGMNTLGQILGEVREDIKRTKSWEQQDQAKSLADNRSAPPTPGAPNPPSQTSPGQTQNLNQSHQNGNPKISFLPDNFKPTQSARGRNYNNRRAGRGNGRGARHFNNQQPSLYAQAQSNHGHTAIPQPHNQLALSQTGAGNIGPPQSMGNSIYAGQPDAHLSLSQYPGMYGNANQIQAVQHAPPMGLYQGSIPPSQPQPSIYSQFIPATQNPSYNVNQTMPMGFSSQVPAESSIYPNHSLIDQSICINSPLPLKPGAPVATHPNQRAPRNRSFSSTHGTNNEVMSQRSSQTLSESGACPPGTSVPMGNDSVFYGPAASV